MHFHWSLTIGEKIRIRVFESRVLRTIFGLNGNEVRGDWRILRYEELHNVHYSGDGIKKNDID